MKIYKNKEDNKLIITDSELSNDNIELLIANASDGAVEKHVPLIAISSYDVTITVGETLHPMLDNHYIECIIIETSAGYQVKYLSPGEEPIATFRLSDNETLINAYCYCNLHGLWIASN